MFVLSSNVKFKNATLSLLCLAGYEVVEMEQWCANVVLAQYTFN